MLPPQNPTIDAKVRDFETLFKKGRRWKGRLFQGVFRVPPTEHACVSQISDGESGSARVRWAVIASKKGVDKRATRRNRAKRRLRALVRETVLPHLSGSIDFALIAGRSLPLEPWPAVEAEMRTFFALLFEASQTAPKPPERKPGA